VLEQDIAISNIALDLLGQARNLFQHAATIFNALPENDKSSIFESPLINEKIKALKAIDEDDFAYLRDQVDFKNFLLVELPKGNWALTILRQHIFAVYQYNLYNSIALKSTDAQLKAIAEKSLKEVAYHITWSYEWIQRLGDGTTESHEKMQEAVETLWPYFYNIFETANFESNLVQEGKITNTLDFQNFCLDTVSKNLTTATLTIPDLKHSFIGNGKKGLHTEHLSYILAELQSVHRTYPNSTW
jgi:ring-1,2-phenylacetyl-CoA epoxidase subunit PaaC